MEQINYKNNFSYLLFSLIALLFSSAVSDDFPGTIGEDIFSIVSIVMLILSLKSIHVNINLKKIVYTLAFILGGLTLLWRVYPSKVSILLILSVMFIFFVGAFKLSVKQILFENYVDTNKIIGSLSLFLLIGLIWTTIYMVVLLFEPTALNGVEVSEWRSLFSRVAYYSFVTLTTLGYGDISPANHLMEFLAYMEATTGLFYMAIFVSSLVGLKKDNTQEV